MTAVGIGGGELESERGTDERLIVRDGEGGGVSPLDVVPGAIDELLPLEGGSGRAVRVREIRERSGESLAFLWSAGDV